MLIDKEFCTLCNHFKDPACKYYCRGFSAFSLKEGSLTTHEALQAKSILDFKNSIKNRNFLEQIQVPVKNDNVNHPAHYAGHGGVECIEAIQASMSAEAFAGYCKGNVLKYLWRYTEKGGAEDLEKAKWYLNKLIEITGPAAPAEQVSPDHNHECDVIAAAGQINLCSPSDKGKNDNG